MRQLYTEITPVPGGYSNIGMNNTTTKVAKPTNSETVKRLSNMPKFEKVGSARLPYNEKTFKFLQELGFSISMVENEKKYMVIDLKKSMENIDNIRENMKGKGLPVSQLDSLFAQLQDA
jgi:hypothetical protein